MKSQILAAVERRSPGRFTTSTLRRLVLTCGVLPAVMVFAGCNNATEAAEPQTCAEMIQQGAFEPEVEDEVKWFDRAIETCDSYDQIKNEMDRWELPGYTVERFLEKRCTDEYETLGTTEVCTVAAPPTTLPEVVENPEWKGKTLDGREIVITPADNVKFVGGVPEVVEKTVGYARQGSSQACTKVLGVRDDFANFVNESRQGQIASAWAQHAQSVAAFIKCTIPPIVIGPSGPLPTATTAPAG